MSDNNFMLHYRKTEKSGHAIVCYCYCYCYAMHNAPAITYYNTACKTIVCIRKHVVRFCFAFLYYTISAGLAIKRALFVC